MLDEIIQITQKLMIFVFNSILRGKSGDVWPEQQLNHQSSGAGALIAEQNGVSRVLALGRYNLSGR